MGGFMDGLENVLGVNTTAGSKELQQALEALQSVGVPSIESLTLPELQKYVSAGVLSPEAYQAVISDPNTYQTVIQNTQDNTGSNAAKSALQQLGGIAQNGSTPIMQAQLKAGIDQAAQANQASRGAIAENAKQRGVSGGGQEFLQSLMAEQNNASNANDAAVKAGANNSQLALNALTQQGTVGNTLQGQANQSAQAQAQAAQQIAQYNSQLQNAARQYNVGQANQAQATNLNNAQNISNTNVQNANARTQYNAALPQQVYQDQMQKATGIANAYGKQGELDQRQAADQNAFLGNMIGTGATVLGGMYGGPAGAAAGSQVGKQMAGNNSQESAYWDANKGYADGGEVTPDHCYAQGGEVHDHALCMKAGGPVPGHASVPGDSSQNDTVNAKLSPGEVVIPRSISQAPDAPAKAAQFMGGVKGQQPGGFADLLQKLQENGLELRLAPKGA